MKSTFILILLFLFTTFSNAAELGEEEKKKLAHEFLEKGYASYKSGNYEMAAQYYNASIQYWVTIRAAANLCNLYLYGQGVVKDYEKAKTLCEIAAKSNDPSALVMLGEIHLFGNGVPIDETKAEVYYRRGADLGHTHGQYVLATLLIDKSSDEAKSYLQKAATKGHPKAIVMLNEINQRANKSINTDNLLNGQKPSIE